MELWKGKSVWKYFDISENKEELGLLKRILVIGIVYKVF